MGNAKSAITQVRDIQHQVQEAQTRQREAVARQSAIHDERLRVAHLEQMRLQQAAVNKKSAIPSLNAATSSVHHSRLKVPQMGKVTRYVPPSAPPLVVLQPQRQTVVATSVTNAGSITEQTFTDKLT